MNVQGKTRPLADSLSRAVSYLRFYIEILPWRVKSDQEIDFTHIDAN